MKFSEQWLREWVNPPINHEQLLAQLTMAGLEVEGSSPVAGEFSDVYIGLITEAKPHPEADRLKICTVDVGDPNSLTIVCGGANARTGLKVAVAKIGAKLPQGIKIRRANLRGVASEGMLCSSSELGLTETSEGILELPETAPLGVDLREWMQLDDHAIEVSITPNRGDCLSILGIAREAGVINQIAVRSRGGAVATGPGGRASEVKSPASESITIHLESPADCPHYVGRVIRNINPKAQTPIHMVERLRRAGIRSISPVVDVTNYVMLELGQPLHAFDFNQLSGGISVRRAKADEKLTLLDGQTITLNPDVLVIADDSRALAMAGIMGGLESAVTPTTTHIFLESAYFNPLAIAGRGRRYNLHTDSAFRYERGVDPSLQIPAIEWATQLLLDIVGGDPEPILEQKAKDYLPAPVRITLRQAAVEQMLGVVIADAEIEQILTALGLKLTPHQGGWTADVPSHRFDLHMEADLIEEIARIYGYDKIPAHHATSQLAVQGEYETDMPLSRLRYLLIDRGYQEVITYSFVDPKLQTLLDPQQSPLPLLNPISSEMAVMRTNLWSGLINTLCYNLNRQQTRLRFFETGLRFIQEAEDLQQQKVLSGIAVGQVEPEQWGIAARSLDFFDIKGDIQALFSLTRHSGDFTFVQGEHAALHPGQTAYMMYQGERIGCMGKLHPKVAQALDIKMPVYLFELLLDKMTSVSLPRFQTLSKFPQIRRDIAFFVNEQVTADELCALVSKTAGDWLIDLQLFDVYQGKGVTPGQKSIALGLILQHPSRTLVDAEVNELLLSIVEALNQAFAITLRE